MEMATNGYQPQPHSVLKKEALGGRSWLEVGFKYKQTRYESC